MRCPYSPLGKHGRFAAYILNLASPQCGGQIGIDTLPKRAKMDGRCTSEGL